MNIHRRTILVWLPAIAYLLTIWILSSLSKPPSVEEIPFNDKGAHFIEYGILAVLCSFALANTASGRTSRAVFFVTCLLSISWGVIDELHQYFVPGRDCSFWDVCADVLGTLLGASLYQVTSALKARLQTTGKTSDTG
jgi:VanZ family protein